MLVVYGGADLCRLRPADADADRPHPAARSRLSDRGVPAAAGRVARAHRCRDPAGLRDHPASRPGVQNAVAFAGFDGATFTNAPNAGVIFCSLKPFEERVPHGLTSSVVLARSHAQRWRSSSDAFVLRAGAAVGARHRHRRRPQGLCGGSGGTRAQPALEASDLGGGRNARRRRPASRRSSRSSTPTRRRSTPTSTAPKLSCCRCRSRACSRRCRSIWARPTSTTSTCSGAPIR